MELHKAIKEIIDRFGEEMIVNSQVINYLLDYQAFNEIPATKPILRDIINSGCVKEVLLLRTNVQEWLVKLKQYQHDFINSFGYKEELVVYVFNSIAYGIGLCFDVNEPKTINKPTLYFSNHSQSEFVHPTSMQPVSPYNPYESWLSYKKPSLDLFDKSFVENGEEDYLHNTSERIKLLMRNYGIELSTIKANKSCIVDYFECSVLPGSIYSKLNKSEIDFANSLSPKGMRLQAPIPGTNHIGIEIPSNNPYVLSIGSVFNSSDFCNSKYELPCYIGLTPSNHVFGFDLAQLPHLLISGASGQGKSMCIHNIMMSLLFKMHPCEVKFMMFDYRKIEFAPYENISYHFLVGIEYNKLPSIISSDNQDRRSFYNLKEELNRRFRLLALAGTRNLKDYNKKFCNRNLSPSDGHKYLPYIVVVIDEYTDIISSDKHEIESVLIDLAKKGKSIGIHLIIATNRPTADIMDSRIKSEIAGRIAFKVNKASDSRIIINSNGAEKLFSPGDALFVDKSGVLHRVQCAETQYEEIERVCEFIEHQSGYIEPYLLQEPVVDGDKNVDGVQMLDQFDSMFDEVARMIVATQQGSTSKIQRHFSIGYNRAGRLMDQMEKAGIVSEARGSEPRDVLISDLAQLDAKLAEIHCNRLS